jgi:hypothetical protein
MHVCTRLVVAALVLHVGAWSAGAWGAKGHEMTARVAVRALPPDMPEFFRRAEVELGYLCPEPDRWRVETREPALHGLADRDHVIQSEHVKFPLPPNRYEFLLQYAGREKPAGGVYGYREVGFAPYAIAEHSEMLTVNFILWRRAPEATDTERRIKRQIEQNIIHIAGLLSHFVTDTGQPLHTTFHVDGWSSQAPNPNGYVGKSIHRRFETDYVRNAIEEQDFERLVRREPAVLGAWLDEAMQHIGRSFAHVERTYALDAATPFGSGQESAEARAFTCERLAASATALRDFWYSAWVKSGELAGESR